MCSSKMQVFTIVGLISEADLAVGMPLRKDKVFAVGIFLCQK
jgi:hypothetical protein